jgi:RNA polymerase sigma factor (sigma-70 family)
MFAAIDSYKGPNFLAWGARIVRNTALDLVRKTRRTTPRGDLRGNLDHRPTAEEATLKDEVSSQLRSFLQSLPRPHRLALELKLNCPEESCEALGKQLGITAPEFRRLVHLAKQRLLQRNEGALKSLLEPLARGPLVW